MTEIKIAKIKNLGKMLIESDWELARAKTVWIKEPETIAWIDSFDSNSVFWDIGANIGIYSLYCAKKHKKAVIHAFEPMKTNFLRLWQNILLNDYINITAHYCGIGVYDDIGYFNAKNADVGSSGGKIGLDGYCVPARSMNGLLIAKSVPNYVKIDTDNNEYDILRSGANVLRSDKCKSVLVEINDHEKQTHKFMSIFGFRPDDKLMEYKNRGSDHNVIFTKE